MTKQKVGLVLFWIAVVWTFSWAILGSIHQDEFYVQVLTFEELEKTVWAPDGPLKTVWSFALPFGALLAGIGLFLYSGVKISTAWKFGIGIFLGIFISRLIGSLGHFPPLYAIGGTLILLFSFGVLWLWGKERKGLQGKFTTAADLKLAGYVFMLIGVWHTCGIGYPQRVKAFIGQPPLLEPIIVMILFVLGWLFLFLGHYKSRK